MEKQIYVTPETRIVKLQQKYHLLDPSPVHTISGNAQGLHFGGAADGSTDEVKARSRGWDDDWDE